MPRTKTRHVTSFTRPSSVTYSLGGPQATITLPPHSSWTSGLHYHATHTEYLSVLQGVASITLSGRSQDYTPGDGIIVVPRYARHEWHRASHTGEDLIVREWTDPEDGLKESFFRNLNSVINEPNPPLPCYSMFRGWWIEWQILVICNSMDNYPVFLDLAWLGFLGRMIEDLIARVVLWALVLAGGVFGLKGAYEEYAPVSMSVVKGRRKNA
ncbi:hypothetical protein BJ875DRAFT_464430 [Amylocarpus encephaloides]|uniref:Cupin type-2 domain-containing protein n=1 Tax=Amylocarpus encephaloides TaxID=45428 RepID=A0A9P7YGT5_9HELO|nr:hypothetical protein BJ875DRAFT_464430 [Amylocarpus encephaloides]